MEILELITRLLILLTVTLSGVLHFKYLIFDEVFQVGDRYDMTKAYTNVTLTLFSYMILNGISQLLF